MENKRIHLFGIVCLLLATCLIAALVAGVRTPASSARAAIAAELDEAAEPAQLDQMFDPWSYHVQLHVQNNAATVLPASYTTSLSLDTATLVSQGRLLSDCADLRIAHEPGGSEVELDRLVEGCNTGTTIVKFKTQVAIPASGLDVDYWLHYGNPASGSPPQAPASVYAFYDDFQDGDAAGWNAADGTWTVVSEASNYYYRYTGGGTGWAISYVPTAGLSDLDYVGKIRAASNTNWIGLAFRIQDPANFLTIYESKDVGQFKYARIVGDNHTIPVFPAYPMTADIWYRLRLQAIGSTLRGRIWLDGTPEPSTWLINYTDTSYQTQTNLGVTLYNHTTNADWDDLAARPLVEPEPSVTPQWGALEWWDNAWGYRAPLTITNNAASEDLPTGYSALLTQDTQAMIAAGQMLSSCDDLRIIYSSGAAQSEIDRVVEGCNTSQTRVWFALQRPVPAAAEDIGYFIHYGNPSAGTPPADGMQVFLFYEDWEQGIAHWTNTGGLDPANTGTMGQTDISPAAYISPANSQLFDVKVGGGDAFSGYIPVSPSRRYAIGVWGMSPNSNVWGPVGIDPYTAAYVRGTETWLWTSEWSIGPQWAYRSNSFTTGATTAFIKIKSELWTDSPGGPPLYIDNLSFRYAASSEPSVARGDEETILPVPVIADVVDNGPVEVNTPIDISATVESTEGTITDVMLRIVSPETADVPMSLITGDDLLGTWQGVFTPHEGGTYRYRILATASTGRSRLSEEYTFTASDTQAPQISLVSVIDPILVRNTQTLVVLVTDNGAVSQVNLTTAGATNPMTAAGDEYSYSWQVTDVGDISYTVEASDTAGNLATLPGSFTSQAREVDVCTWKDCKSGAASFSVDDGSTSCRAELEDAGMRGTYYYNGNSALGWFADYSAAGHEIASHTVGHPCNPPCCFPTCTPETLDACPYTQTDVDSFRSVQLDPNIQVIESQTGLPVLSLAWPCGCTDPGRMQAASFYYLGARGYYDWIAQLTWLQDVNAATPVKFMNLNSANAYNQTFIDQAINEGKWAITTSHGSCDGITYMSSRGDVLWNAPVGEVLKYIKVRDAAQFNNYLRFGRTINFDVAHNLTTFTRQTLGGAPLLPIAYNNPVTLKVHLEDTDSVLSVLVDAAPVGFQVRTFEGTRYVTFDAGLDATRQVTVNLAEPAPTIGTVSDNSPVEVGGEALVTAIVTNPGSTIEEVTLRVESPNPSDYPMSLVSSTTDLYSASFTPTELSPHTYVIRASNDEGNTAQSVQYTLSVIDTTPPSWRNQAQGHDALPAGQPNQLSSEGYDMGLLRQAILMTDETGIWQEFDLPANDWWDFAWPHRRAVVVNESGGLERVRGDCGNDHLRRPIPRTEQLCQRITRGGHKPFAHAVSSL